MKRKVMNVRNSFFLAELSIFLVVILKYRKKIKNFKLMLYHLYQRCSNVSDGAFHFQYYERDENKIISLLKSKGYDYSYIHYTGGFYFTNSLGDFMLDHTMRAIPDRENTEFAMSELSENVKVKIKKFFPKWSDCLNIDIPYSPHHVTRVDTNGKYPHSECDNLLRILKTTGLLVESCNLYYHGALSYAFNPNNLIDISEKSSARIEEDEYFPTIYTYFHRIENLEKFIRGNYQKIVQDSSVFDIGDTAFGFYDSGLNIMNFKENDALLIRAKLEWMGYKTNQYMFYEIVES